MKTKAVHFRWGVAMCLGLVSVCTLSKAHAAQSGVPRAVSILEKSENQLSGFWLLGREHENPGARLRYQLVQRMTKVGKTVIPTATLTWVEFGGRGKEVLSAAAREKLVRDIARGQGMPGASFLVESGNQQTQLLGRQQELDLDIDITLKRINGPGEPERWRSSVLLARRSYSNEDLIQMRLLRDGMDDKPKRKSAVFSLWSEARAQTTSASVSGGYVCVQTRLGTSCVQGPTATGILSAEDSRAFTDLVSMLEARGVAVGEGVVRAWDDTNAVLENLTKPENLAASAFAVTAGAALGSAAADGLVQLGAYGLKEFWKWITDEERQMRNYQEFREAYQLYRSLDKNAAATRTAIASILVLLGRTEAEDGKQSLSDIALELEASGLAKSDRAQALLRIRCYKESVVASDQAERLFQQMRDIKARVEKVGGDVPIAQNSCNELSRLLGYLEFLEQSRAIVHRKIISGAALVQEAINGRAENEQDDNRNALRRLNEYMNERKDFYDAEIDELERYISSVEHSICRKASEQWGCGYDVFCYSKLCEKAANNDPGLHELKNQVSKLRQKSIQSSQELDSTNSDFPGLSAPSAPEQTIQTEILRQIVAESNAYRTCKFQRSPVCKIPLMHVTYDPKEETPVREVPNPFEQFRGYTTAAESVCKKHGVALPEIDSFEHTVLKLPENLDY